MKCGSSVFKYYPSTAKDDGARFTGREIRGRCLHSELMASAVTYCCRLPRSGPSPYIHPSPSLHHYFSRGNRLVERIQYSILATFFNGMIIRGLFVTVVGRGRGKIDRVLVSFGRNYWTSCYRLIAGNNVRVYNLASYLESFICEC